MKKTLSNILFLFAGICFIFCGYIMGERIFPSSLNFQGYAPSLLACVDHNKKPVEIRMQALSIDLPIIPSKISQGSWETTLHGVSYLASSPVPGEKGNSILYGHNFSHLLGKLPQSKPGDMIAIVYNDTTIKKFRIRYTSLVDPKEIDILKPSNDTRITIYTCAGFLDGKRFVVVAELVA